jgi:CHAD domain-containing protein
MSAAGDGKWLEGLTPDMKVSNAARLALSARLAAVRAALGPAAELSADPEPVHQLRVATRRAAAALNVFGSRLPARVERRTRRALRQLRRAAAAARDADVFLVALDSWVPGRPNVEKPGLQFLFGHVTAERRAAQDPLCAAIERCDARWAFRLERCPRAVRRGGPTLAEYAATFCADLDRDFDAAVTAADFDDAMRLHALRIAAKRLRYAFELLTPALSQQVADARYTVLSDLQRILGIAHDCWQAILRLDRLVDGVTALHPHLLPSIRAGINAFRTMQREQFAVQKAAFATWRTNWPNVRNLNFEARG